MNILATIEGIAKHTHKHRCDECDRKLIHGRGYRDLTISDNGTIYHYKLCGRCARWADIFVSDTNEYEWEIGAIDEYREDVLRSLLEKRKRLRAKL